MPRKELIIASDLHIAAIWDKVDKKVPEQYNFLNPNANLQRLVKKVKATQSLILNGDLVDYYYADYNPKEENNWDLFYKIIEKCKGQVHLNLGNHDYRSYAYNFSIYGLQHVNLSKLVQKKYVRGLGFSKFRFFQELKCFLVDLHKFNPLHKFNSQKNYSIRVPGYELIFLNTGPDAATQLGNFFKPSSYLPLLRDPPPLFGLTPWQLLKLRKSLKDTKKRDCIVFIHAPAFFSPHKLEKKVKIGWTSYTTIRFQHGLTFGSFVLNNWLFIRTLMKTKKNIIVVSGHIHMPKQYIIDKQAQKLWETSMTEVNELRHKKRYIKFISLMSTGSIMEYSRKVGYLVIGERIKYKILGDYTNDYCLPLKD